MGSRIVAVADAFGDLTLGTPGVQAVEPERAIEKIQSEAGRSLYADACEALASELGGVAKRARGERPAGLTDREVEILRLVSSGWSRKRIAKSLVLSENTVRHHVEHIYDKIGVSNRASAALFAMEHSLIAGAY